MEPISDHVLPTRIDGLEVHEVDDGFIVYQEGTGRVHCLNHTAAMVLEFCDGTRSLETVAELLAKVFALPGVPLAETVACVDQLRSEGVLR